MVRRSWPVDSISLTVLPPEGVIKTYKLTYESVEVMHALFDKKTARNRWRIGSNVLRTFIEYFGAGTEQLDIYSEEGRVAFTSYTEKIATDKGLNFNGHVETVLIIPRNSKASFAHLHRHRYVGFRGVQSRRKAPHRNKCQRLQGYRHAC